jgi:putative addiction module component (TIGR02574 family)
MEEEINELDFEAEWAVEIARRSAEIKSGAVKTIPWEEVRRGLFRSKT